MNIMTTANAITNTNGTNGSTATLKRSFDFKRTDHYLCDPVYDLCIIGGATMLPEEERGVLDTAEDKSHVLHDPRLLLALEESFICNVDTLGVLETIVIAKMADVAVVVAGRSRVRAARIVNARRAARGEPLIKVPCVMRRSNETDLLSVMIAENEGRHDEDVRGKIDKLKRLMARGVDVHQASVTFNTTVAVIENWLRFDDLAIERVKDAVDAGKLALSAGLEIARLRSPEKQAQALDELTTQSAFADAAAVANGKPAKAGISTSAARAVAKKIENPTAHQGVKDKRSQRKLFELVQNKDHKNASKEALAWWSGVEAALQLIVGSDEKPDERLLALLGEARVSAEGK